MNLSPGRWRSPKSLILEKGLGTSELYHHQRRIISLVSRSPLRKNRSFPSTFLVKPVLAPNARLPRDLAEPVRLLATVLHCVQGLS